MQLACFIYRCSHNPLFIDDSTNRENMRSEGKIKFKFKFRSEIALTTEEWTYGIHSKLNIIGQKTRKGLSNL